MSDSRSHAPEHPHPVTVLRNFISLTGVLMATVSAGLFLVFFVLDVFGLIAHSNPYLGIIFFIILPSLFVLGLLLIPLGAWRERRRQLHGLPPSMQQWPRVDLNDSRVRTTLFAIAILTPINLLIVSAAAYKGVEAMDSVGFCGQTCHEVMEPEFVAYQHGPHARVKCVDCHIGEGAGWFVRSKLSGARQVYAVMMNSHSRPIPSPVHNLRPARDTCEQCHWPTQFHGDKIETRTEYAADEANTESVTTLRLRIGGVDPTGRAHGIHWHVAEQNRVEYVAFDDARQTIGYVRFTTANGEVREYYAAGVTEQQVAQGERRLMDCVDCHNRPAHRFARSADRAVNQAIAGGLIAKDLPYVKREGLAALEQQYPDKQTGMTQIPERIMAFYRNSYPALWTSRQPDIERSAWTLQELYRRNVFPTMKVSFGAHADNQGHMEFPGCFRCHDEAHQTKDGKTISQSCDLCHEMQ